MKRRRNTSPNMNTNMIVQRTKNRLEVIYAVLCFIINRMQQQMFGFTALIANQSVWPIQRKRKGDIRYCRQPT